MLEEGGRGKGGLDVSKLKCKPNGNLQMILRQKSIATAGELLDYVELLEI